MAYNITNVIIANESGMLGFVQGVNTELMMGWFGTLILIGICAVIFISLMLSTNDVSKAAATTGFISFALALPLVAIELAPPITIFITLIFTAITVAFTWRN